MGHHGFDYSIWEKNEPQKQDKLRHSQRIELKQMRKRKQEEDEWEEWDD